MDEKMWELGLIVFVVILSITLGFFLYVLRQHCSIKSVDETKAEILLCINNQWKQVAHIFSEYSANSGKHAVPVSMFYLLVESMEKDGAIESQLRLIERNDCDSLKSYQTRLRSGLMVYDYRRKQCL